jgi:hypothetical protein
MDREKIFSRNYDGNCKSSVATVKRSKVLCLLNCHSKLTSPAVFITKDFEALASCYNLGTLQARDGKQVERLSLANSEGSTNSQKTHNRPPFGFKPKQQLQTEMTTITTFTNKSWVVSTATSWHIREASSRHSAYSKDV